MDAGASMSVKRFIPQPARLNVGEYRNPAE